MKRRTVKKRWARARRELRKFNKRMLGIHTRWSWAGWNANHPWQVALAEARTMPTILALLKESEGT